MVERKMAAALVQPALSTMSTHFELQMVRTVVYNVCVAFFINWLVCTLADQLSKSAYYVS